MNRLSQALLVCTLVAVPLCSACRKDPDPGVHNGADTTQNSGTRPVPVPPGAPVAGYKVVKEYPHDPLAFTQGLLYHGGSLYEGTGLNDSSSLRQVDLATGAVKHIVALPAQYFGEGLALLDGKFYQLTWQNSICFVYDAVSFKQVATFNYYGEGWGLTTDGTELIMSDGTSTIRFIDPKTFKVNRTITVFDAGRAVDQLNELEYVKGEIYANVWKTDRIVRINPKDGSVIGWIDLKDILPTPERTGREDVLNGIAYDAEGDRLFVTGKHWAKLYQITLVEPPGTAAPVAAVPPATDSNAKPGLK